MLPQKGRIVKAGYTVEVLSSLSRRIVLTLAPLAIDIQAPIVAVVEAKREDINAGIPQGLAELVAAQIFNAAEERSFSSETGTLYGIVTTGTDWKFLKLEGQNALIDADLYYLDNVEKIVGIVLAMLR